MKLLLPLMIFCLIHTTALAETRQHQNNFMKSRNFVQTNHGTTYVAPLASMRITPPRCDNWVRLVKKQDRVINKQKVIINRLSRSINQLKAKIRRLERRGGR